MLVAVVAVALLASCDKGSRQDRFCRQLADDQALLASVPADPDELDAFVERYHCLLYTSDAADEL